MVRSQSLHDPLSEGIHLGVTSFVNLVVILGGLPPSRLSPSFASFSLSPVSRRHVTCGDAQPQVGSRGHAESRVPLYKASGVTGVKMVHTPKNRHPIITPGHHESATPELQTSPTGHQRFSLIEDMVMKISSPCGRNREMRLTELEGEKERTCRLPRVRQVGKSNSCDRRGRCPARRDRTGADSILCISRKTATRNRIRDRGKDPRNGAPSHS
jgi:hypothetical protein